MYKVIFVCSWANYKWTIKNNLIYDEAELLAYNRNFPRDSTKKRGIHDDHCCFYYVEEEEIGVCKLCDSENVVIEFSNYRGAFACLDCLNT